MPVSSIAQSTNQQPRFSIGTGVKTLKFAQSGSAYDVKVLPDGKMLIAGNINNRFSVCKLNSDGSLDTSFGNGGWTSPSLGNDSFYISSYGRRILLQSDGTFIVAGTVADGYAKTDGYVIARYKNDGTLDTSFNRTGIIQSSIGISSTSFKDAVLQADGKIIIFANPSNGHDRDISLVRYNQDGSLDSTFNGGGLVTTDLQKGSEEYAHAVQVQSDGKVLVAVNIYPTEGSSSSVLVRYNSNGTLDSGFDKSGGAIKKLPLFFWTKELIPQIDGKLLLCGYTAVNGNFVVSAMRLNSDGSLDLSFNKQGYVISGVDTKSVSISPADATLDHTGRLLIFGHAYNRNDDTYSFALWRFNLDGSPDIKFGNNGRLDTVLGNQSVAQGIEIQPDNKIVVTGQLFYDGRVSMVVTRYDSDGKLDLNFGLVNSLDAVKTYNGGSTIILDEDVQIYDAELSTKNNFAGSSLKIERQGGSNYQDHFGASGTLTLENSTVKIGDKAIGTFTNSYGTLTIAFNSNATQDLVNAALCQISYSNSNKHFNQEIKFDWTFNDGSGASNSAVTGTSTVNGISIANQNAPVAGDIAIDSIEDTNYIFKLTDFKFSDGDSNDALQSVKINVPANQGRITLTSLDGRPTHDIQSTEAIDVSDIAAGRLIFTPVADAFGAAASKFTYTVSDSDKDSLPAQLSFTIASVNDVPSGTVSIIGTMTQGQTLTASNNITDNDGLGDISYQWKIDGVKVEDATSASFQLPAISAGKKASVDVSYTDLAGTMEVVSSSVTKTIGHLYIGTTANETFNSNGDDESYFGDAGIDTVRFNEKLANYKITKTGVSYSIQSKTGLDGNDVVTGVEALKFADMTVNLEIQGKAANTKPENLSKLIELYIAFFNRIPDANGLSYWLDQLNNGTKLNQIADAFFAAGVQFSKETGFTSDMSSKEFINRIYINTLGRTTGADADGLAYWTKELESGRETHGSLVQKILSAAHTFKTDATYSWVSNLLDNKILVGLTVAVDLGINFNTEAESISKGMEIANAITPTDAHTALELIGVQMSDIVLN